MYKYTIALLLAAVSCNAGIITGTLSQGNILNWDLTVTDPTQTVTSYTLLGPLSGNNSQLGLVGSDLVATATTLTFNFSGSDNGYLLFQHPTLFNGFYFWCSSSAGFPANNCSDNPNPGEALATNGQTEPTALTGMVVIASGGVTSGNDVTYTVDQTWTIGNNIFNVTGTIEVGPTPEPCSLGLMGLGMAVLGFRKFRALRSS